MATKKKTTAKKASTKKKATAKKSSVKKATAKKASPKKATATKKKASPKKATAKKATAKKATATKKKATAKKATAKKATAKKATATKKKASPKKATAKKANPKKATATKKKASTKKKVTKKKTTIRTTTARKGIKKLGVAKGLGSSKESRGSSRRNRAKKEQKIVARISFGKDKQTEERKKIEANYKPLSSTLLDNTKDEKSYRYSDSDLAAFAERIEKKLKMARKELDFLQNIIKRSDDTDAQDTSGKLVSLEDGNISAEREKMSQLASRQISFIEKLEAALVRIENKTYGICRVTGKLIEKERLHAVPHATLSMEAKLNQG